jgi:hypothetical protein
LQIADCALRREAAEAAADAAAAAAASAAGAPPAPAAPDAASAAAAADLPAASDWPDDEEAEGGGGGGAVLWEGAAAASGPLAVRFEHVTAAIKQCFGSPHVAAVRALPQHARVILLVITALRTATKKAVPMRLLRSALNLLCRSKRLPEVPSSEFSTLVTRIAEDGLVRRARAPAAGGGGGGGGGGQALRRGGAAAGGGGAPPAFGRASENGFETSAVELQLQPDDVEFALTQDNALFAQLWVDAPHVVKPLLSAAPKGRLG